MAIKLANQGYDVRLWARRPELAEQIAAERENRQYLPYVTVPPNVSVTADLELATRGANIAVIAVIAGYMREIAERLRPLISDGAFVLHGTKGLEPSTWLRQSVVLCQSLGEGFTSRIGVLAGPNHAEEVARGLPGAAVVASHDEQTLSELRQLLSSPWFRVYTNLDVVGVELCSAAKNVVAIAAGIGDGLGYGDNSKAALITRALAEIGRLVERQGGMAGTVSGLAGIGDVVATCTSRHSRNRWAGEQIGRGRSVDEIVASTPMVIEGIPAARAILALAADCAVEMPICAGVHRILFEGQRPDEALQGLMARGWAAEG